MTPITEPNTEPTVTMPADEARALRELAKAAVEWNERMARMGKQPSNDIEDDFAAAVGEYEELMQRKGEQ